MGKKEELHEIVGRLWRVHHQAMETFDYCFELHKQNDDALSRYVFNNRHLRFIKVGLWKLLAIELSKLFGQDGFPKLLKGLKKDGYYKSLKFNDDKIIEWERTIDEYNVTITQLKNLRDKVYAHTDTSHEQITKQTDITFSDTKVLIELGKDIIGKIYSDVFDSDTIFNNVFFDCTFKEMLQNLQLAEESRINSIMNKYRRNKI